MEENKREVGRREGGNFGEDRLRERGQFWRGYFGRGVVWEVG
jgi:hypothetical protein